MVGAGKLIQLLFGLNYHVAVVLVGVLMVLYVLFGGMLATTWVQIIKAVLLLCGDIRALSGSGSDVRYRRPAAYSDALLYRERCQRSA